MHDLATLHYLNLRASGAVRIVFLTAVFTRAGLQAGYPGGVPGFRQDHPDAREDRHLLTITSMSSGELGETLDAIAATGLDLSACCAVADAFCAMTSKRSYADALEPMKAVAALVQDPGFDPECSRQLQVMILAQAKPK